MSDRKMLKWAPFDAVLNSNQTKNELSNHKTLIDMPILDEYQIEQIEKNIHYAYNNKLQIKITYYNNGRVHTLNNYIKKLDYINKKIVFNNYFILSFECIISTDIN